MGEITIAAVDQAVAALLEAKEGRGTKISEEEYRKIRQEVGDLRRAYKEQEVAAGRRGADVSIGGDAFEGGE